MLVSSATLSPSITVYVSFHQCIPESTQEEDPDDEYALAGVKDPKILLTTSRDPSSRLAQFAKVCLHTSIMMQWCH